MERLELGDVVVQHMRDGELILLCIDSMHP